APELLIGREAGNLAPARRGVELVARDLPVPMAFARGLHCQRIALFRKLQRRLRLLALRDVGHHAGAPHRAALRVAAHLAARAQPAHLARGPNDAVLEPVALRRTLGLGGLDRGAIHLAIPGMELEVLEVVVAACEPRAR